jgi:hypothetical protein
MSQINYLRQLPGGICFAHGPYTGMECPKGPTCVTSPQNPEYVKMALDAAARTNKRYTQDDMDAAVAIAAADAREGGYRQAVTDLCEHLDGVKRGLKT